MSASPSKNSEETENSSGKIDSRKSETADKTSGKQQQSSELLQKDNDADSQNQFNRDLKVDRDPEKRLSRKTAGRGTYGECVIADERMCGKDKQTAVTLKNGVPETIHFQNQQWQRDAKDPSIWNVRDNGTVVSIRADVRLKGDELSVAVALNDGSKMKLADGQGLDLSNAEAAQKVMLKQLPRDSAATPEAAAKKTDVVVISSITKGNVIQNVYSDGTIESYDLSSRTKTIMHSDGDYEVNHNGQTRFTVAQQKDHSTLYEGESSNPAFDFTVKSSGPEKWTAYDSSYQPMALSNDKTACKAREDLCKGAEARIKDPEQLAKFRADIAKFENRVRDPAEIADTYSQLSRLLKPNSHVNDSQSLQLIRETLSQAANPSCIDQGQHNTCNVSTVESKVFADCPSKAAKVIADVACTGRYEYAPGRFANIDDKLSYYSEEFDDVKGTSTVVSRTFNPFKPDQESSQKFPVDGTRSYASQLFQVAAIQSVWASEGTYKYYVQMDRPLADHKTSSERLVEHGLVVADSPDISDPQIVKSYNMIAGDKAKRDIFVGAESYTQPGSGVVTYKNMEGFENILARAKEENRLPLIFQVDTHNEPFFTDSGRGAAGGSGGCHVVTITNYEPGPPAKINFDNQWGSQFDHLKGKEVSLRVAYMASLSYFKAGHAWQAEAKKARDAGKFDVEAEYELLQRATDRSQYEFDVPATATSAATKRYELTSGVDVISDDEFVKRTASFITAADQYYAAHKDDTSAEKIGNKFASDFFDLPKRLRKAVANAIPENKWLSKETVDVIASCK